jgi:serine/threonine protein kinase
MLSSLPDPALTDLVREMAVMKRLDHPNVVKLREVVFDPLDPKLIIMVMEYLPGGTLLAPATGLVAAGAGGAGGAGFGGGGDAAGGVRGRVVTEPLPEALARSYFR